MADDGDVVAARVVGFEPNNDSIADFETISGRVDLGRARD